MCSSRKYPYSPNRRDWKFLRGGGLSKARNLKLMYETWLEFPERWVGGGGGSKEESRLWGRYRYFERPHCNIWIKILNLLHDKFVFLKWPLWILWSGNVRPMHGTKKYWVDKVGRSYRLPSNRITLLYSWFQMSHKLPAKSELVAKENTFHESIKRSQ